MFRSRRSSNARYLMTGFYDQVSMNLLDLFPTLFNETNMVLFHSNRFISCIPPCINAFHTCPLAGSSVPMSFQRLPATSRYRALPKGCISQKSRHLTSQMKAVRRSFITGTIAAILPCTVLRATRKEYTDVLYCVPVTAGCALFGLISAFRIVCGSLSH